MSAHLRVGRRVQIVGRGTSMGGMTGTIQSMHADGRWFVLFDDGDPRPIPFSAANLVPIDEPQHVGGAE